MTGAREEAVAGLARTCMGIISPVPQYIFAYRDDRHGDHRGLIRYVLLSGISSMFSMVTLPITLALLPIKLVPWKLFAIYLGVIANVALFLDYAAYRVRGVSCLRALTLRVDDRVQR
eukprot:CAMPEP_0179145054 /NCGR_PEP_ID=MMETSP0796-20121207/69945_1 /TAXON_ID=73915 /ORGANISM="Pyrodinium bahamense, Strain pbaha01" /LENGTH=116 /DNA_ID=CAMNT_0020845379 /DNA_START=322 /DNA_END=668 /DNA_ORIENTATION=-